MMIIEEAAKLGLRLNPGKCEIITNDPLSLPAVFGDFIIQSPSEGSLLGAPLLVGSAMSQLLEARCMDLERALERISLISSHDGLVMLKNSISAPKLLYTLRCSPAYGHELLDRFD